MNGQPEVIADRAHALRTCPAQAPEPWEPTSREDTVTEVRVRRGLDPVIALAQGQLERLPEEQRGELWLDLRQERVIVQVTRDADVVLAELRGHVDAVHCVAVELVRYARTELEQWAEVIMAMDDIGWTTVGCRNANNRVEVGVSGDTEVAWRRIAASVDPCAFRVSGGVTVMPLTGLGR